MKPFIKHILFYLLLFFSSNILAQENEFKNTLINKYGVKDSLTGSDIWIFDKSIHKITEVKLEIFKNEKFKTYLVDMTWILDNHITETKCLFTFNEQLKKINFTPELWAEGYKKDFYKILIGHALPNIKSKKKFVKNFEKLIQINNSDTYFTDAIFDKKQTIFSQYFIKNEKSNLWRIIILNHPDDVLKSISIINPKKSENLIK